MRISLQTLLEIEDRHNPDVRPPCPQRNAMRGVCSHAIRCHELVAGGKQFGRSRNNIEASIEYGMLSPHIFGAGEFTNESQVRIAFAWVLWRACSRDPGSGTTGTPDSDGYERLYYTRAARDRRFDREQHVSQSLISRNRPLVTS
jgi:hypothetical protein